MRLWNIVVSLAMVALGLAAWRASVGAGLTECPPGDSTCAAIEELGYLLLSLALWAASIPVLFVRSRHLLHWAQLFAAEDRSPFEGSRVGDASATLKNRFPFEDGRVGDAPVTLFD
jgi:hypothetical protein